MSDFLILIITILTLFVLFIILVVANVIKYKEVKKRKEIFESAEKDLEIMQSILNKFKSTEMPLDQEIINKHFKLFDAAEESFNAKKLLYDRD